MRIVSGTFASVLLVVSCGRASPHQSQPPQPTLRTSPPVARVVHTTQVDSRTRDLLIDSPAVGHQVSARVIVPTAFSTQPTRRWPVLLLLHGCCDSYVSWTRSTDIEKLSAATPVLIVMPDGGSVGFYSDWQSGGPKWETLHLVELMRILTETYRASDVRAVAGLSMGGLGALAYSARHSGMFRAAASFSGIANTRLNADESAGYVSLVRSQGEDPAKLWGDPVQNASVWEQHNPYDLAPKLRGTALFLSVGTGQPGPLDAPGTPRDPIETSLHAENESLAARLHALGIPATIYFYGAGTHNWPYWQRALHRAWPMFTHALGIAAVSGI